MYIVIINNEYDKMFICNVDKTINYECENYMKNAKNKIETKQNDDTIVEKILTIADVARELNIDTKRARAFLRKNNELYTMRKQKFTKSSSLYRDAINALTIYKNKNRVVTK